MYFTRPFEKIVFFHKISIVPIEVKLHCRLGDTSIKMLQQILKDMYIDPELLAELSDEQKQILFVKMREEQVRKYTLFEDEVDGKENFKPRKPPKPGQKQVGFLKGKDGKDWVWVMGDHKNDKSIEQILEEDAKAKAMKEAELEAQEKEEREEEEFRRKLAEENKKLERMKTENEVALRKKKEEAALSRSLTEARLAAQKLEEEKNKVEEKEKKKIENMRQKHAVDKRRSFEIIDRRSGEIYIQWKKMRLQMEKMAEEGSKEVEDNWKKQEKKAKEAENELRDIARRAREEHKESLRRSKNIVGAVAAFSKPPVPSKKHLMTQKGKNCKEAKSRPARPPNKAAVIEWFMEEEYEKGSGRNPNTNKVADWFHGVISRVDAENLLLDRTPGSFLVRVSERVWGYTISYRTADRCKHFLIDTTDGTYQFFGENQICHNSLWDLINFHKNSPITVTHEEKLLSSCAQIKDPPDYQELFSKIRL
ncbi:hypothetical protein ScPMuIL_003960 [Solemya velum]